MADSLTEFLGLLAHSKECKGLSRCRSRKGGGPPRHRDGSVGSRGRDARPKGTRAAEVPDQTQSFVNVIGRGFSTLWTRLTAALPGRPCEIETPALRPN